MKLSLILPVYNVEKYLGSCIESCLHQDIPKEEYEIIVVIDGSPDNSIDIAQTYASKNANIRIIERPNGGLSAARNTGLIHAQGEYVWFIDSDDFIENNCFKDITDTLQKENLDCLWIQWKQIDEHQSVLPQYTPYIKRNLQHVMDGQEFMAKVLSNHLYAWSFIYRRDFLKREKLIFTEGMFYEDTDFALRALPLVRTIKLFDRVCYNYLFRKGSITHEISEKKLLDILTNASNEYKLYQKEKNKDLKNFYHLGYSCFILLALKEVAKTDNKQLQSLFFSMSSHIKNVKVHGNTPTKLICLIYNMLNARLSYSIAHFLLKKMRKKWS